MNAGSAVVAVLALAGCDQVFGLAPRDAVVDAEPIPAGLSAWYRMDALDGNRIIDSSGHGHDGRCTAGACPTPAVGTRGGGLRFNGAQIVHITGMAPELDHQGAFTVAAWIFVEQPLEPAAYACFFNKLFGAGVAQEDSWQLCVYGPLHPMFLTGNGVDREIVLASSDLTVGQWHHVAGRNNGSTSTISLDGVDERTMPGLSGFDGSEITIGADIEFDGPVALFSGVMDDLRIYDRELSTVELIDLATRSTR